MNRIFATIVAYMEENKGATAVEYGLIAGGISIGVAAGVFAFGDELEPLYEAIGGALEEFRPAIDDQDYTLGQYGS